MAKFLVTSGAKFTPFNYDELVKPLAQMAEAHATTQNALDTMALEAGNIAAQIGSGEGTERSRALYDAYMNQLQATTDELYNKGYNASTMRGLSKARAMYGSDIGRIQQAIKQRDARADEYRKAVASNPTLITEYNPLDRGLDNWLDNPQYGYYQSYSGETLINQGKLVGDNLRKEMIRDEQSWRPVLGNQYYERIVRSGYTSGELAQALDNVMNGRSSDNPAIAALQQSIGQIYESSGMDSWASAGQRERALNYIGQGMSAAVGDVKVETEQNRNFMTDYQRASLALSARSQALEEEKWRAKQEEDTAKAAATASGYITPTQPVNSTAEQAKAWAKDYDKVFAGFKNGPKTVKTADGRTLSVRNWQEATSLVYNGRARNAGFEEFGFDIAVDPLGWFQSTKSMQIGKTVLNGKEYNIRTGPADRRGWKSGITNDVAIYVETSPGHWGIHKGLTEDYKALRKQVKDSRDYYRKNYKDVYDAALNPEQEKDLRDKYSVPSNVPTIGLVDAINASPTTQQKVTNEVIIAQSGDNGKAVRNQLAAQLKTNYDELASSMKAKAIKRSPSYSIRKMKDGVIKSDKVTFGDVFTVNKQGEIDNLNEIRVTPESIQEDMFIVKTGKGSFAVPVQMFGSASISYQQHMKQLGTVVSTCLNNASYLANADVSDPNLRAAANALSSLTGQIVNAADVRALLATSRGREDLTKWYQQGLMTSVPALLGSTVRFSRFPAASLTSSKDPE